LGEGYRVSFTVRNGGIEASNFRLVLYHNSSQDSVLTVLLAPDSLDTLTFTFPGDVQGTNEVSLHLDSSDCFPEDNSAFAHFVVD